MYYAFKCFILGILPLFFLSLLLYFSFSLLVLWVSFSLHVQLQSGVPVSARVVLSRRSARGGSMNYWNSHHFLLIVGDAG